MSVGYQGHLGPGGTGLSQVPAPRLRGEMLGEQPGLWELWVGVQEVLWAAS